MNDNDQDVRAILAAGTADQPPGIDLLRGLREERARMRGTAYRAVRRPAPARRQGRRRMAVMITASGVAIAGAGTALGLTLTATAASVATSVAMAPSALAAVTAAVDNTSSQTFQFSVTSSRDGGAVAGPTTTGAFDPARKQGEETLPIPSAGTPLTVLLVGGHMYAEGGGLSAQLATGGKPWVESLASPPLSANSAGIALREELSGSAPIVDPSALLALLKSAGSVTSQGPASGTGWTGTKYTFTARTLQGAITGTVLVDNEDHVRSLETTVSSDLITAPKAVTPVTAGTTTHASAPGTAAHLTVTFGDFGVSVSTTPPAAGQVDNLGANYLALVGRSKFEIIPADLSATSPAASTPVPSNPLPSSSLKSS
ncbi:MAG TPA: hypothetical protein VG142_19205 [Trebonia sp.]|nr:hypothetical protein [Trebonia sp.]